MEYDNFVFYGSWRESLEGFREEFGDDYAKEALWNLMLAATAGDIETERKSIIGFISGAVMPNVNKAKDRYAAAIENGKKGGRPKVDLNEQEVLAKKKELGTWKATAQYFGVDEDTLRKQRKTWEKTEKPKNPNPNITIIEKTEKPKNPNPNPNITIIEKTEKPKNLDIDIDIDIDIDNEKEKEIEKEKEKEPSVFSFEKVEKKNPLAFSWFDDEEEEERKRKIVESAKQVRLAANPDNRFRDEEEQEYFDFIKGANIEKGMSETTAEEDAWQMILDDREYWDSKVKIS